MLRRLFAPRWQHQDPRVRERAVGELDPTGREDLEVLATLARGDASEEVRASAAIRLLDLQLLDQLIRHDRATRVREAASRQVCALLAGTAENNLVAENRLRMIRLTDNQQVLAHVAEHSPDADSRQAALERLDDPHALLHLALRGRGEPERHAAAQRLEEPELLRRLVREGRDKRVQRTARERLKTQHREQQEQAHRATERQQVLDALNEHCRRAPDHLYRPRLRKLLRQWEALAAEADEAETEQARELLAACEERIAAEEARQRAEEQAGEARENQQGAVEQLHALFDGLSPEIWEQQLGSLRAAVGTQRRRWETACEIALPDDGLLERYTELARAWETMLELAARAGELAEEGDAPVDDPRLAELAAEWPEGVPAPAALGGTGEVQSGDQAPEEARDDSSADERFRPVLAALNRELQRGNLRQVNRLWHKAEKLLAEQDNAGVRRRLEQLRPRRDELRDWHDFAASPKKEALCERMEQLADTDMDPQEKASAIQAIHEEWRSLMSSDQEADQALWDRFRDATDRAYEPCREYFREQDAERAANLEKRRALCDQLDAFIRNQDWDRADWPAVWEIRRRAPEEWHSYQPVRFTDSRETTQRFSALLRELDAHLDAASETHRPRLERLIEEAESLAEAEKPDRAFDRVRELQQRWKQAGWVLPRQYRPLNKRFRRACDRVFAARDEQRQARREEFEQQATELRQALEQLGALMEAGPAELDTDALARALEQAGALPCPPRERELEQHRDELVDRARRLRRELPRWREWQALCRRLREAPVGETDPAQRELAVALEVLGDTESPEDAREERMAWQLEQLPRAMKGGDAGEPVLTRIIQVVDDSPVRPEQGLATEIRDRLLHVLEQLEPRA